MSTSSALEVAIVDWDAHKEVLRAIRGEVFIEEQGVPKDIEWDNHDQQALHFLATLKGKAIGCGRRTDVVQHFFATQLSSFLHFNHFRLILIWAHIAQV